MCDKSWVIGKGSLYISGICVKESLSLLYNIVDRDSIYHGHSTVSGVGETDESGRRKTV